MTNYTNITSEQALAILVNLDVAAWGESEREASRASHAGKSRGMLINAIAYHTQNDKGSALTPAEKREIKSQLTKQDKVILRKGG